MSDVHIIRVEPLTDDSPELLEEARRAFERRDWAAARDGFKALRVKVELEADDFSALGDSGKAVLAEVTSEAGFAHFRLAAETPFNLILEVRP
jgi:hypothetical protein